MITMQEAVRKLDRDLDALLARQIRQDRANMRRDGVGEAEIRIIVRMKIEDFRETKAFALPAVVAAALGQSVPPSQLH
jgi:hypothetical protein